MSRTAMVLSTALFLAVIYFVPLGVFHACFAFGWYAS